MFMSLSKTFAKVGGLRFGIRMRLTKSNAFWYFLTLSVVYTCQFIWYCMVLAFWLMYAFLYGMWWCFKKMYSGLARKFGKTKAIAIILAVCVVFIIIGAIGEATSPEPDSTVATTAQTETVG